MLLLKRAEHYSLTLFLLIIIGSSNSFANSAEVIEQPCGCIIGRVVDASTNEPLGWTTLVITELNRGTHTNKDGYFYFQKIQTGTYTLKLSRVGYKSIVKRIAVIEDDTLVVNFSMETTPFTTETVFVVAENNGSSGNLKPTEVITGKKLQQQLGRTLAETLNMEPGISQRTMGPAPARPVLRGLGGDRLLILEDGNRTGDLSATAPDHAVVIDPMSAERIEIIRGPGALLFGSNAMGGVINVIREQIPRNIPDHIHGSVSFQGETVNKGRTANTTLLFPFKPIAFRIDAGGRKGNDIQTPAGSLKNTYIENFNTSAGLSIVLPFGFAGIAGNLYKTNYGIPGGFVGAHPNGVRIELERKFVEAKGEVFLQSDFLKRIEINSSYSNYNHIELESNGSLGTAFSLLTFNSSLLFHIDAGENFNNTKAGLWFENRDFAASGFVFTPATIERTAAGYIYSEFPSGKFTFQGALRFDGRIIQPEEKFSSVIGNIRKRTFGNISGAISGVYELGNGFFSGLSINRAVRFPGIEELYSEGPHLAAYSFEVGNPELKVEHGIGSDLFLRYEGLERKFQLTLFRNDISNYIYTSNTGRTNYRTLLPIYQFSGNDILLYGIEAFFETKLIGNFIFDGSFSFVRGEIVNTKEPLPMIPPLSGKIGLKYSSGNFNTGINFQGAAAQNRIEEFETSTAGFFITDIFIQYQFVGGSMLHTFVLTADNITDKEYRMHLSRVKSIMPEPGRNVKLLYRVYF